MRVSRLFVALLPLLTLAACNGECASGTPESSSAAAAATTAALTMPVSMRLAVKGMHCEGCEGAICGKVEQIAGVTAVKASHTDEAVDVTAPAEQRDQIVSAIKKLGYTVE
jgi:copper chaperone